MAYLEPETRPMISFSVLRKGMTLYQPDFQSPDGISEFVIQEVLMWKVYEDPKFGDEISEITADISEMNYYSIGVVGGWETNCYEKFVSKKECQVYMLSLLEKSIEDNEAFIARWQTTTDFQKNIKLKIIQDLKLA